MKSVDVVENQRKYDNDYQESHNEEFEDCSIAGKPGVRTKGKSIVENQLCIFNDN